MYPGCNSKIRVPVCRRRKVIGVAMQVTREDIKIGYDIKVRDDCGTIYSGYVHNFDFEKRPHTIWAVIFLKDGTEVLADLISLDSIVEIKKPEGEEFSYLEED